VARALEWYPSLLKSKRDGQLRHHQQQEEEEEKGSFFVAFQ